MWRDPYKTIAKFILHSIHVDAPRPLNNDLWIIPFQKFDAERVTYFVRNDCSKVTTLLSICIYSEVA